MKRVPGMFSESAQIVTVVALECMCGLLLISTLNQEGVGFSETLVPVYQMI
jgi:hypothetical protein